MRLALYTDLALRLMMYLGCRNHRDCRCPCTPLTADEPHKLRKILIKWKATTGSMRFRMVSVGWAVPLVSITMASGRGSRRRSAARVRRRSPSSEQQTQPFAMLTTPPLAPAMSSASMLMLPKVVYDGSDPPPVGIGKQSVDDRSLARVWKSDDQQDGYGHPVMPRERDAAPDGRDAPQGRERRQ